MVKPKSLVIPDVRNTEVQYQWDLCRITHPTGLWVTRPTGEAEKNALKEVNNFLTLHIARLGSFTGIEFLTPRVKKAQKQKTPRTYAVFYYSGHNEDNTHTAIAAVNGQLLSGQEIKCDLHPNWQPNLRYLLLNSHSMLLVLYVLFCITEIFKETLLLPLRETLW